MSEEIERHEDLRAARLLAGLAQPSPAVVARVRTRLNAPKPAQSGLRLVTVGAVAALAAASVLFFIDRSLQPQPVAPVAVATSLSADGAMAINNKVPGVSLSYNGEGEMSGMSDAPQINWQSGTLNVEVVPDHGIRLAVQTEEAQVRVVGTGFTVQRDALGTAVNVRHGKVEVDCSGELTRVLEAGDSLLCLPDTQQSLLMRARLLTLRGASHAEVLATYDRALALPAVDSSVDETRANRLALLVTMGRAREALDGAASFLKERPSSPRRDEVVGMAVAAASTLGGCASAAPWLVELAPTACK